MKNPASHWYDATTITPPDINGSSIVGGKWVEVSPGKSIHFDIILKANGDFVVACDRDSLVANGLQYNERTIYAPQAQAMPSQIIWSIILEGVKQL
ncbi:hypothetical protein GO755_08175 [Spirosoma sp. HMF4905]|uniref:Uncharacterized protein n=1 Tax=Spirosoma arboris TaxID=2682092 RepID=A0A7K1S879_9BACT|nr:hypothetical protein [Spirosoma arboris]MVM30005.1 hypothetical protein [Spirosoma arboris]